MKFQSFVRVKQHIMILDWPVEHPFAGGLVPELGESWRWDGNWARVIVEMEVVLDVGG